MQACCIGRCKPDPHDLLDLLHLPHHRRGCPLQLLVLVADHRCEGPLEASSRVANATQGFQRHPQGVLLIDDVAQLLARVKVGNQLKGGHRDSLARPLGEEQARDLDGADAILAAYEPTTPDGDDLPQASTPAHRHDGGLDQLVGHWHRRTAETGVVRVSILHVHLPLEGTLPNARDSGRKGEATSRP